MQSLSRRSLLAALSSAVTLAVSPAWCAKRNDKWDGSVKRGLDWLVKDQSALGHWVADSGNLAGAYPVAMTALAGTALLASGSTATQGPYAKAIRKAVDYLLLKVQTSGLIGDPETDNRYTYGHGFAMLFLSQLLGEEEDKERRNELVEVLTKAVEFSGRAQTSAGGWGYVSAKALNDFDEGSTTITQVQGLRGCRNAGIVVPGEIIEKAKKYIYSCKNDDGGISYSSRNMGESRPAITAAALATLYNAGDYDSQHVPKMLEYAKQQLHTLEPRGATFGHWQYTYLYYSQVVYRQGEAEWGPYRDRLYERLEKTQAEDGSWKGGSSMNPVYPTACNLIMFQLDLGYLPIYQR
jgi:Prenyltransferase and squalene oxidase repeat